MYSALAEFEKKNQDLNYSLFYILSMTFYEQIQKALDFIEKKLFCDISGEEAAQEAYMSLSNFYRYFTSLTGFTFKEYIRKRRLSESLNNLRDNKRNILDVALQCLFESNESFSRAFRKEFGMNPSQYRKNQCKLRGIKPLKLVQEYFMGIIIKELPDMEVAYYRVISKCPENDAWYHLKKWADQNAIFDGPYRIFGFNNPSPEQMRKHSDKNGNEFFINEDNSEYGYEFWITLNQKLSPEDNGRGVCIKKVSGGRFAVLSIGVGCEEHDIEKGWGKFSKMLSEGNFRMKGRWFEEHMNFNPDGMNENFRMDLYVEIE